MFSILSIPPWPLRPFFDALAQKSNLGRPWVALCDLWETFGKPLADLWVTFGWPLGDLWVTLGDLWETFGTLRSPNAKIDQKNRTQNGSRSINSVSKPMSKGCPIPFKTARGGAKKSIITDKGGTQRCYTWLVNNIVGLPRDVILG